MQDLSDVTGSQTIVKIAGQEVLLGGYTFEDIGAIQGAFLKSLRQGKYEAVLAMKGVIPDEQYAEEWTRAREECARLVVTKDDFANWMITNYGFSTTLWILAERQYPGKFTRQQILTSFTEGEISEEKSLELLQTIEALQQRGNK